MALIQLEHHDATRNTNLFSQQIDRACTSTYHLYKNLVCAEALNYSWVHYVSNDTWNTNKK